LSKKTLKILKKTGNDGIVQVKGNQKFLLKDCERVTECTTPRDTNVQYANGRGRKEKRVAEVFTTLSSFTDSIKKQWGAYIRAVIKITRSTTYFNTKTKRFEKRSEEALYVATTKTISAKDVNHFIREHWSIENRNHYVRDVTFQEDASRIRRNPDRMVRLRSFALNILRVNHVEQVSLTRFKNGCAIENMLQYKGM
jgi:predicted transposase YbfD/YdcC